MEHTLAKTIIVTKVTELISDKYRISINEARDKLYKSNIIDLIDDDETGLYGESPLYVFSLFEEEERKAKTLKTDIPNKNTMSAIEEAEEIEQGKKKAKTFTNVEGLMKDLEK